MSLPRGIGTIRHVRAEVPDTEAWWAALRLLAEAAEAAKSAETRAAAAGEAIVAAPPQPPQARKRQ